MSINLLNDHWTGLEPLGREEMDLRLVSIWDTQENWNLDTIFLVQALYLLHQKL